MALVRPHGLAAIVQTFGDLRAFIKTDGTVRDSWPRLILATVELPEPLPLAWDLDKKVTKIRCHKLLVQQFAAAFRAVADADLWGDLHDFAGVYNFRTQRGASKLSAHAFGIAIDVSAAQNPLGEVPKMHPGVIQAFEAQGFFWGGRFSRPDGMHFQFCEGY